MASPKQFVFEKTEHSTTAQRTHEQAEGELETLFARLGVEERQALKLGADMQRLLLKYCMEVPGNIAWYQSARARAERDFMRTRVSIVAAVILASATLGGLVFYTDEQVMTAQIGTVVLGILFVLQVLAASSDKKAQIGSFWKASSDLKEALYTFEHGWQNRVFGADGLVSPDFETALWQEVRNARQVCRQEREAYFNTFRSPTEILNLASMPFEALRQRSGDPSAFKSEDLRVQKSIVQQQNRQMIDTRQALLDTKARLAAAQSRLDELSASGAKEIELADANASLVTLRAEVVRYTELLRMQAKAEMLNP